MEFRLPDLKYSYDALEPVIDKETMEIHYTKHHQAYINNLEKILKSNDLEGRQLDYYVTKCRKIKDINPSARRSIANFSGGHYNHSLFWRMMCPPGASRSIDERLEECIKESFESHEKMVEEFNRVAISLFGSGWTWLCYNSREKNLVIAKTRNQDTMCMRTSVLTPILGLDVWEHAYYLKYNSARSEYVGNWWKVVNWDFVSEVFIEVAINGKKLHVESNGSIKFE